MRDGKGREGKGGVGEGGEREGGVGTGGMGGNGMDGWEGEREVGRGESGGKGREEKRGKGMVRAAFCVPANLRLHPCSRGSYTIGRLWPAPSHGCMGYVTDCVTGHVTQRNVYEYQQQTKYINKSRTEKNTQ